MLSFFLGPSEMSISRKALLMSLLVLVLCSDVENDRMNTLVDKVNFYPSSLVISHSPKPLTLYHDTKLLNIHVDLTSGSHGNLQLMTNHSCSILREEFFNQILKSVKSVQKSVNRLFSFPGFTSLIECSTYLPRLYQFSVGQPALMLCARTYRKSVRECKKWALSHCRLSTDERKWLEHDLKKRFKRSSWMCHFGVFGLFRSLYKLSGHSCESNSVKNLKRTLKLITRTMSISQQLTRKIDGKVVYLFKVTDAMNTKLNVLSKNLKMIDLIFSTWASRLNRYSNTLKCHDSLTMEFLSKYSAEVVRTFFLLTRLFEAQDTVNQLVRLNEKPLIGISDLPNFLSSRVLSGLMSDHLLVKSLKTGLDVLAGPLVEVEHNGRDLSANVLLITPKIADESSFCVVEHLTPVKFNVSNKCFVGPIKQNNLVLVTCPGVKKVVAHETLKSCFQNNQAYLCHASILDSVSEVEWLGFPWNADFKISFPRHHQESSSCDGLHPMIHLGGRYFLSTTAGTLILNTGTLLNILPLTIYHFPCNVSFYGMESSLSSCPETLSMSFPLFTKHTIRYVKWSSDADDNLLNLHHQTLQIPPPTYINKTIITELDRDIAGLDEQLTDSIRKANKEIEKIKQSSMTTMDEVLIYFCLALSSFNFVLLIIISCCLRGLINRRDAVVMETVVQREPPLPPRKRKKRKDGEN